MSLIPANTWRPQGHRAGMSDEVESLLLAGTRALEVDGDLQASRRWFDAAYDAAATVHDGNGMARAAIGLCGQWVQEHRTMAAAALAQARLRYALDLVDPRSRLALRLRARLAGEEDFLAGRSSGILAVADEARRAADSIALAEAVGLAHHCMLGPDHGELRRRLSTELVAEGMRTGRRHDLMLGMLRHTVDLLLAGDPQAQRGLTELRTLLSEQNHRAIRYVVWAYECMLDIRAGRLARAEANAAVCREIGHDAGDPNAIGWFNAQLGAIRWYQGRTGELVTPLRDAISTPTLATVDDAHSAGLAVAAASAGDKRQAESAIARLRSRDLNRLPRSSTWLVTMYAIVEAANLLADKETAATTHALLEPYGQLPMMASLGIACFGSVRHALGVAALTTGDHDAAVAHLRAAVRANIALEHWPATMTSRMRLALALEARGRRDDLVEAARERSVAAREAAELDISLPKYEDRIRSAQSRRVTCARQGRRWLFRLGAWSVEVAHSVGMIHLATLLANPGSEVAAVELAGRLFLDDAVADDYRLRLAALQQEIDGEGERAERARDELDRLLGELAAAVWDQESQGSEERARIAVGKAIRRAIARIEAVDPVIGRALSTSVHTGLRCYYRPF